MSFWSQSCNKQNYKKISNKKTQILGYADDSDIIGRSQAAARAVFYELERDTNKVGLKINGRT
jgi:hypothetical protein